MNRRKFLKAGLILVPAFPAIIRAQSEDWWRIASEGATASSGGAKTPDQVAGLKAWYKGDTQSVGAMTAWSDATGGGRNLAGTATVISAGLNGKNTVRSNGTSDKMNITNAGWGTADGSAMSFLFVHKTTSNSIGPVLFNWGGGQFQIDNGSVQWDPQNPTDTNTTAVTANAETWGLIINGASSKWRKNGGAWTSFSTNPGAGTLQFISIFATGGGAGFIAADMAEIAVYNVAISTSDGDAVFLGFQSKWATF